MRKFLTASALALTLAVGGLAASPMVSGKNTEAQAGMGAVVGGGAHLGLRGGIGRFGFGRFGGLGFGGFGFPFAYGYGYGVPYGAYGYGGYGYGGCGGAAYGYGGCGAAYAVPSCGTCGVGY